MHVSWLTRVRPTAMKTRATTTRIAAAMAVSRQPGASELLDTAEIVRPRRLLLVFRADRDGQLAGNDKH
jgi:hypothetical protein